MQGYVPIEQYEQLEKTVILLAEKITQLEQELAQYKRKSNKSNKPPSSDGYSKPTVKNTREKSERKPGGQVGHQGSTRTIAPEPDSIVKLKPLETACECGGKIVVENETYTVRQVIELQKPTTVVIEYRQYRGICNVCGKEYAQPFPEAAKSTVTMGTSIQAMLAYLVQYQLLPLNRTAKLMEDTYGLHISEGTIVKALKEAHDQLEPFEKQAKEILMQSPVVHFDETGMRVDGSLHWMHSVSTPTMTLYEMLQKRGTAGMDEMGILPTFAGVAVHDHWKAYYQYGECAHAECNAHILRQLKFLHEDMGLVWASKMAVLLLRIKRHVDYSKMFEAGRLERTDLQTYECIYRGFIESAVKEEEILEDQGGRIKTESRRMRTRLAKYEVETLTFMYDFAVPFDNNLAERDIRMPKAKQKISGCFRTDDGSKAFARTRSFISTCTKQGLEILDGLKAIFAGDPLSYLGLDKPL